ncbi:MAG: sulfotransferase family protein [Pseudomonadota bacterium]
MGDNTQNAGGKKVVCVLGMHRSGTSCLTGCLEELGLYLGDVVTAAKFNLKGNRESNRMREINDDLLAHNGGAWDRPPERLAWDDALRARRDAHIESYRDMARWGFKDPRTVITLPFWQEAGLDLEFVATFRHPFAVARSLLRRPGVKPETRPIDLWKMYNLKLIDHIDRYDIPLISFDWPPEKYLKGVEQIAEKLGLDAGAVATLDFFEEALRNDFLQQPAAQEIGAEEKEIYEELNKRALTV